MTEKNKDITHILRLVTIPLIIVVMLSAGAIGCGNGGGGGCCCGCCDCGQPCIEVSKTVWNPISEEWVEEITTNVGDIVRFNCTIHNNGTIYDWDCCNCNCNCCKNDGRRDCCNCNCNCCNCYNLTNITVLDVLPDGLVYVINSATPAAPTYISTDNRTVRWEFPDLTLDPGESITIEFNVSVIECVESVNRVNVSAWYKRCVCEDGYCGCCCCCCGDCDGCGCEDVKVSDEDTATVVCTPTPLPQSIDVDKTVWDGTTWADSTDACAGETVRFGCIIRNNGECNLTNITVLDVLPAGLVYVINSATPAPTYIATDNRTVRWEFPDLTLESCDSITIEFNASVIECVESVNCVNASAWYDEVQVSDEDTATVVCTPAAPDIAVDKTVWDGTTWADSTSADVNDTVRFRCIIYNSGTCCNLTNTTVLDVLPAGLVYVINSATPAPTYIATDNRTVRWEFPDLTLESCDSITIEFNASVIDCVESVNRVNATAWCGDTNTWVSDEDTATVVCTPTPPPAPVPVPTMSPIGTALLICVLGLIGAGVITRRG